MQVLAFEFLGKSQVLPQDQGAKNVGFVLSCIKGAIRGRIPLGN